MAWTRQVARIFAPTFCRILTPTTTPMITRRLICQSQVRNFSQQRRFCSSKPLPKSETVSVTFVQKDGQKFTTQAKVGDTMYDVVVDNDLDIDGFGACEATLACSTCHLIFTPSQFNVINEKPSDEELDMLDLAYGLTDTSRLGCQVEVTKEMDGWEIEVPSGVADAREP